MANVRLIIGLDAVLRNLKARHQRFAEGVNRGLRKAGLRLQREAMLRVPVEFGVLKASAFTRAQGAGLSTVVTVGFTAAYALFVHEKVGMKWAGLPRTPNPPHKGYYWDPQGRAQAKFLESPARTMTRQLRQIILDECRLK